MKYGADDLDSGYTSWDKIAQEHLSVAQDLLNSPFLRGNRHDGYDFGAIALAQAHSLQALALIEAWSK